jgi:hypothetical protein
MNGADACLWHPWLRINRVLRVMLQTRWGVEAWTQVKAEFRRASRSGADSARGDSTRLVTALSSCGAALVRVAAFG